jgi:hypothetical protein
MKYLETLHFFFQVTIILMNQDFHLNFNVFEITHLSMLSQMSLAIFYKGLILPFMSLIKLNFSVSSIQCIVLMINKSLFSLLFYSYLMASTVIRGFWIALKSIQMHSCIFRYYISIHSTYDWNIKFICAHREHTSDFK